MVLKHKEKVSEYMDLDEYIMEESPGVVADILFNLVPMSEFIRRGVSNDLMDAVNNDLDPELFLRAFYEEKEKRKEVAQAVDMLTDILDQWDPDIGHEVIKQYLYQEES